MGLERGGGATAAAEGAGRPSSSLICMGRWSGLGLQWRCSKAAANPHGMLLRSLAGDGCGGGAGGSARGGSPGVRTMHTLTERRFWRCVAGVRGAGALVF
jgi:hypothetical protein